LLEQSRPAQVLSNALFTLRTFRSGARSVARRPLDGVGRQLAPGPYARAGPSVNRRGMTRRRVSRQHRITTRAPRLTKMLKSTANRPVPGLKEHVLEDGGLSGAEGASVRAVEQRPGHVVIKADAIVARLHSGGGLFFRGQRAISEDFRRPRRCSPAASPSRAPSGRARR